jgi:DNA-binding response OmpR family regulator
MFDGAVKKDHRLLVIDDSEETVAGLQWYFSKNYEVLTASDGLEGLKLLEEENEDVDLVITDIVMPNISGVGVIKVLKKKYDGIPVIAFTGWGEHPGALAIEANADAVIEKPIEPSELDRLVGELLNKRPNIC